MVALNKRREPGMETLILQAAAEIKQLNPRIGEPLPPYPDEEYAQLLHDAEELERVWNEIDRQQGGSPGGQPAADAVDEDRGE